MSSASTPTRTLLALIGLGFLLSLLALYQWMELLLFYAGGELACSISETFDCAKVWATPFSKGVRSTTGMPIAAWGLVYGAATFAAGCKLAARPMRGEALDPGDVQVVRVLGVGGVLGCLGLGAVSFAAGAVCVLCVATYWLVFIYAFLAFRLPGPLKPKTPVLIRAGLISGAWALVFYLILLAPGLRTPTDAPTSLASVTGGAKAAPGANAKHADGHRDHAKHRPADPHAQPDGSRRPASAEPPRTIEGLVARLPPGARQSLSDALGEVRAAKPVSTDRWPGRLRWGEANAPVAFIEFTDIKCGHCAQLADEMKQLASMVPPGSFSVQPRQFPLDAECNPTLDKRMSDGSKTRCTAARALICLEEKPTYWDAHHQLFAAQDGLDNEKVLSITSAAYGGRAALVACLNSKKTAKALADDIEFAKAHDVHGTPLLLMNGRQIPPMGAFIYAMILAKGDPNAPAFASLPPARPPQPHRH